MTNTDVEIQYLHTAGYDVKITSEEVRVFSIEYDEMLDLDKYNTLVRKTHDGDILFTLMSVVQEAVKLLESR